VESQIHFVDSQTLTPKPEVKTGRVLVSSRDLSWDGIYIEKGEIERQRLGYVIDYIEAHLNDNLSLADIALAAGLSKFHFSRLFKAAIGLTPHQYVLKRRIERAATQLKKDDVAIAAVAHQFGFTDQSHFTRTFKQFKGMTPKAFKQGDI
jgi:AraC family transcriptional regulator